MPTIVKLYSLDEASEHNTRDDCWVVIDGKVYDVTSYLDEHPGGDDVLLSSTGKDATDDFEDAGHSQDARKLMKDYLIGELDTPTICKEPDSSAGDHPNYLARNISWLLPVAVVGFSMVVASLLFLRKR